MHMRDVVVIGSGPAGCTAGMYCARAMLRPLVIAGYMSGGQLMLTSDVENYPGYKKAVPGPQLMEDLKSQAEQFGAEFVNTDVAKVDLQNYPYKITTADDDIITTKSIIIATGANAQWLNAPNEELYRGKGISSCATCDGALFKGKDVVVIGGGDSAMEEAQFLTRFVRKVTLIHRSDKFRASKTMLQRVVNNNKVKIEPFRRVNRWLGSNGFLQGVELADVKDESLHTLPCDGAFIAIGHKPNTNFLEGQVEMDELGYIKTNVNTMTSKPGVFACGDVVDKRYKQAITAAGQGCAAALDCEKWLEAQSPHD